MNLPTKYLKLAPRLYLESIEFSSYLVSIHSSDRSHYFWFMASSRYLAHSFALAAGSSYSTSLSYPTTQCPSAISGLASMLSKHTVGKVLIGPWHQVVIRVNKSAETPRKPLFSIVLVWYDYPSVIQL